MPIVCLLNNFGRFINLTIALNATYVKTAYQAIFAKVANIIQLIYIILKKE